MKKFQKDNISDYNNLFDKFELKKRKVFSSKSGFVVITIPISLIETIKEVTGKDFDRSLVSKQFSDNVKIERNKLKIDVDIFKDLFQFSTKSIVSHLENIFQHNSVRGCSTIIMAGGFSESELLQEEVKKSFPSMTVIIPKDAGLAVLKGAVIFGHNPTAITERICKYTYGAGTAHVKSFFCTHPPVRTFANDNGVLFCDNMFNIHVKKGQAIKLGEKQPEQIGSPIYDTQSKLTVQIYTSTEENPIFVTDIGCQLIGQFDVPVTGGTNGRIGTTFMFGGTEIEVIAEDKLTGMITKHRVEFLG